MSAIEQLPPSLIEDSDRRTSPRVRIREEVTVILGRGEGSLVDISRNGARVRHSAPVKLGSHVRISFEWQQQRFSANGIVLASRVIALGIITGSGATTFESRLRFTAMSTEAAELLDRFMDATEEQKMQKWIANLRGWEAQEHDRASKAAAFIRCRYRLSRWERKWTRDASQPEDGFTVPASIDERELALLCRTWESGDATARDMLRDTARVSVESVLR
ncbi:MAG: PilZ domain-containing protein [Thermoanaerobaculia bacterium]